MDFWFFADSNRLSLERQQINHLQETSDWLEGIEWYFDSRIGVKAQITAHDHLYHVKLIYPQLYPSTPPIIKPVDEGEHWSEHQYGDGTLCLEWGPDNWHSSISGAKVLESAFRLIESENPLGKNEQKTVLSRHYLTEGQELRRKPFRFFATNDFLNGLTDFKNKRLEEIKYATVLKNESFVIHAVKIEINKEVIWENKKLPSQIEPSKDIGWIVKTELSFEKIKKLKTMEEVKKTCGINSDKSLPKFKFLILIDQNNAPVPFFGHTEDGKISKIPIVTEKKHQERIPDYLKGMAQKKIGVVGLGSIGSKIALSLARMGIEKFHLVDDDIFLPENITRHTLDWRDVASHKVEGIKDQLNYISSNMKVSTSKHLVGGQEATTSLDAALSSLGNCDCIIDATANPSVFNYLAAVSVYYKKPMVWGEVFAGGIGGMIARRRPGEDPEPQTMRSLLNEATQGFPDIENTTDDPYQYEAEEGKVMTASDADVSVIASHMTRIAADTVLELNPSTFPYSMYLIGLSKDWIFNEPFETQPIKTDHLEIESKEKTASKDEQIKNAHFIKTLLEKAIDKSNPSKEN